MRATVSWVEQMAEGAATLTAGGLILFANEQLAVMLGLPLERVIGSRIQDFVAPESRSVLDALLSARDSAKSELRLKRDDGRFVPAYLSAGRLRAEGIVGITLVVTDLTEQQKREEALRDSEARFRALVTASSEVLYRMSPDWSEMRQLSGGHFIADTEAPRHNWLQEYIPPDEQSRVTAVINEAIRTKSVFELEHRVRRVDGTPGWTFSRAIPMLDANGQIVEWFGTASDIIERKQAEEALRESEARERARAVELEAIMDAVPVPTFISRDPECREMIGSRASYELLRVHPGSNLSKADPDRPEVAHFRAMTGGQEIPVQDLPTQRAAASGETIRNYEFDFVFDDGSCRTVLGDAVPMWDESGRPRGAVAAFLDITERKQAEQRLRDSEQRYRALFESMREGFVLGEMVCDPAGKPIDWRYLDVNPACETMLRRKRDEMVGRTYREIFPDAPWEYWVPAFGEVALSGNPVRLEHYGSNMGRQYEVIAYSPRPGQFAAIFTDVTDRKAAEERLRQAQKLESVGLLAGGVAHDFNNLLTVILGNASSALDQCPSCEHSKAIVSAAERAAHLTRQLLAYAGKGRSVKEAVDISDLVSRSKQLLGASVPKRVNLVFNLSKDLPAVEEDPSHVEQILMNLVINAGEAIAPKIGGRIEVSTGLSEITPEIARQQSRYEVVPGTYVWLEVRDNDGGMDEATLSRIFDPFFSTKFTGRGLGLAAVDGIVRSSKGFIEVRSFPGGGTTFRVFLPATGDRRAPEVGAPVERQPRWSFPTVLVVDDEEMVRKLANMILRRHGYEVLEATDGKHALQVLAESPSLPSVVLLDLAMPVMGGDELVPILAEQYPSLKVIISSGYPEEEARNDFRGTSVAGFLQKPYTAVTLTNKIDEILGGGPQQSGRLIQFPKFG